MTEEELAEIERKADGWRDATEMYFGPDPHPWRVLPSDVRNLVAEVRVLQAQLAAGKLNGALGFMDDHQVCDEQLREAEAERDEARTRIADAHATIDLIESRAYEQEHHDRYLTRPEVHAVAIVRAALGGVVPPPAPAPFRTPTTGSLP